MSDSERQQYLETIAALTATLQTQTATIAEQAATIARLESKVDALTRLVEGRKRERAPRVKPAPKAKPADPRSAAKKRDDNRAALQQAAQDGGEHSHEVSPDAQVCAHCGDDADFRPVGDGRTSELYDYVPGYFRRSRHVVHSVACTCGKTIVSAKGPDRATPKSKYGPGLAALCITHKCVLGMPIHRIEKLLRGHGTPVSRSTLNELFVRVANKLEPIVDVLLQQVRAADLVLADETKLKLVSHNKQAWMWVFIGDGAVVFVFSRSRGSAVATEAIGGTTGTLLTDGYSGYNPLTGDGGRDAARCHSHLRRELYEALPRAPEAQQAIDLYQDIFRIEADAHAKGLAGSDQHLRIRQRHIGPLFGKLKKWLALTKQDVSPASDLHKAIEYVQNQWRPAMRCLYDPNVPLTNNESERTVRCVAIGRKAFYGVQSHEGGHALATLYSLVATCEAEGVDAFAYLTDVIVRIETEPAEHLTPRSWAQA